jgi:hypothetical protein
MNMLKIAIVLIVGILAIGAAYRMMLEAYGFTVTSWWRSPWHNTEVGGVKRSLHQLGLAFDVVPMDDATIQKAQDLGFNVLIEDNHLHLQLF